MQLLCYYKQFIENTIMKLGEDWRIESNLLAQEIVAIKMRKAVELAEEARQAADFNIFNEFLSAFLKGKIGNEFDFARHP